MKNLIKLLFFVTAVMFGQTVTEGDEVEEVVVKGNVLYSDQVNALKKDGMVLKAIFKALRKGETVLMVMDQNSKSYS